ncbi:hypothetical protein BSN82_17350 [Acinetobacter baylyi]|uniref:hypothetical protein n=1 Tax=Acinetobacter baylyi TaxID=202950 RepID=UPI0013D3458E|nr:hypothetical protein [Acinetobacter baylyi]KAF2379134.1 hypothetical protein BSN82_17350 [Acinetobacter baylyi]
MEKTLEVLLKQVRDKRDQVVEAVANNAAKDYSEYQKLCGEIRGLSITEGFILDLAKKMEFSDE